ncbi:MAG: trigger factor [Clostridia bacterium]|nr:trigger factor [Clostridia bacterium]
MPVARTKLDDNGAPPELEELVDEVVEDQTAEPADDAVDEAVEETAEEELAELEENQIRLTVTVPPEDFAPAVEKAFRQLSRQIVVPGFRRGKAPRAMVERMYGGPAMFYEDAFDEAFPPAYDKAVENIKTVSQPEIEKIDTMSEEEGIVCTVTVWTYPKVTLGEYKNLGIEKDAVIVDQAAIDEQLQQLLESRSRLVDIDRPIETGDTVTFDFVGSVDGEEFDGGSAEDFTLEIGSNRFIPGFEEQMVGLAPGENKKLEVAFPEDYHEETLRGKPAVFDVTVKEIQVREKPEADDAFIQDATGTETLAEWRENTQKEMEEHAAADAKNKFENDVVNKCVENATFSLPQPMIERGIDTQISQMSMDMRQRGYRMEDYLKYMGQTMEDLREQGREQAVTRVSGQVVIDAIREAEGIKAEDEDIDNEIATQAERMGMEPGELKEKMAEDHKESLAESVSFNKTLKLLLEWNS